MATLYSSVASAGPLGQSTLGPAHARTRTTLATYDGAPTTSDTLVIGYFKSSDRIIDIDNFTDGAASAGALNVGLHSVNFANGDTELTVVDADLFASALPVTLAIAYDAANSIFDEAGTLDDVMDRGKTLWELAAVGAASYTEDPGLTFAITATPSTTVDAATEMGFEVTYVAGD